MKKVIIHQKNRVFSDFLNIDELILQHEQVDGTLGPKIRRLVGERGDSCAALLYHRENGELLMVKQFRPPTYAKGPGWLVELVAGSIAQNEAPHECMEREILEETGYQALNMRPITSFYSSPGGTSERIFLYYAEVSEQARPTGGGGLPEEHEDIEVLSKTPEAWWQDFQQGLLPDAKTIIALLWWRENFKN